MYNNNIKVRNSTINRGTESGGSSGQTVNFSFDSSLIRGAISTVINTNLFSNRVLVSNSIGKIGNSYLNFNLF